MEQFNLKKYLANPSRKVVTRDGINARIICTDRRDYLKNHNIIALLKHKFKEEEIVFYYTMDGRCSDDEHESKFDLFFAPEKHEGWVNILREEYGYEGGLIYDSKEDAEKIAKVNKCCVATVKIEWEE